MPLAAGAKLGPYEIISLIGKGGMGEVYRARDPRTGRDVAVKVSTEQFSERFDREVRAVAALNHPNICTLFDVGPNFLVMEYVEGEAPHGPLPLDEAMRIAKQIADALEAAHERGITHRDLKPGNIKIKPDGMVKVLDFGLAKIDAPAGPQSEDSPTLSMAATKAGMILGTAAYMAPEQARGKPVDKRADIWAFGVVLYEILTGQRLFKGEDITETLASVVKEKPDLSAVPPSVRPLLQRCLEKDPKKRLRDIGDMHLLLDPAGQAISSPASPTHSWLVRIVAAVAILALAALAFVHFREAPPEQRVVRFQVPPPEKSSFTSIRLSPDGRYLAFVAFEAGRFQLWVRAVDSLEARVLPGTDGAGNAANQVFWSPDSAFIGFVAGGKLKKVSVTGGPPQNLADVPGIARATWGRAGVILVAPGPVSPIQRVPAAGGVLVPVTKPEPGESHFVPDFLPDGQHFLYYVTGGKPEANGIYIASLEGMTAVRLLPDMVPAAYVPSATSKTGHLLFRRDRTLMAQPFDPETLRFAGDMFPVADPVTAFTVSENGALAYASGTQAERDELVWMDRTGKQIESAGPPGEYGNFRLSPDEKRIVFNRTEASNTDIWVLDLIRGVPSRITFDPATDNLPIWSADGLRVLWPSSRSGGFDLYIRAATGTGQDELLIKMGTPNGWGTDWSRDGKYILYQKPGDKAGRDLWIAPQSAERAGEEAKPFPYLQSPFNKQNGVFSPDGHWIAYVSDESGRDEVYVQAFPLTSEKKQISTGGGTDPAWRKDGSELFYLAADRNLMAVPVRVVGTDFQPGVGKALFPLPGNLTRRAYAPAGNGQRFLISRPIGETAAVPVTVVLNWQAGVTK
jgi:Tol biopolymer transport system component/tRNA A-37 threonylcarbamoyl transferase component Bud32